MSSIDINVNKIKEYSADIIQLSKEYNEIIQEMYETLENLNEKNILFGKENEENSSNKFTNTIKKEKNMYTNFGMELNKCGNILNELGIELEKNNGIPTSKIIFESEPIKNESIKNAQQALEYINSAKNCNNANYVDIETQNGYINDELNQISNMINNYIEWANNNIKRYNQITDDTIEKLKKITSELIIPRQTIVNYK